jgi:hypothetical protein
MSATYTAGANTLKKIEGGYCRGGSTCGTPQSGETYRGIDRVQQPGWPGWKLIDAYKRKYGTPKYNTYFTGIDGAMIDREVDKFWSAWWNGWGFGLLKNQYLAELLYTWSAQGPNRAIADINEIGKRFGAMITSTSKITPDVANAINKNLAAAYQFARTRIITWYKTKYPNDYQKFVGPRVNVFPVAIQVQPTVPPKQIIPATPKPASSKSLWGWFAGLFSLATIYK